MKDWGEGNWREFFASTVGRDDQPVILLGNPKEYESLERIRSDSYGSVNLAYSPPTLAESLALLSMSQGYLGRDSGVMHMAAATGVPVLAAYGGGHWGRFLPSSGPAIAVTQAMSCRMCDFYCLHENPRCITEIRMETMIEAWRRLSSAKGVEILEQPPDPGIDTIPIQRIRLFCEDSERDRRRNWAKSRVEGKFRRLLGDALGFKNLWGSAD
jgi:ADP-heptose:LPS heptosyltransferase